MLYEKLKTIVSEETAKTNPMIVGRSRTGKTTGVLIPLFEEWKKGKLFINLKSYDNDFSIPNLKLIYCTLESGRF